MVVLGCHFYLISEGYDMTDYSIVPLASLVGAISFCFLGFSNTAYSVVGELFAPNIKAVGTSLTNSIGFAFGLVSVQLFYAIKSAFGIHFGIWSFALSNIIAFLFTLFLVPDTSKMSLQEIQVMLNRPWFEKTNKVFPVEQFKTAEVD